MANQHSSPKRDIMRALANARRALTLAAAREPYGVTYRGLVREARYYTSRALGLIELAPASTRRRWRSGR